MGSIYSSRDVSISLNRKGSYKVLQSDCSSSSSMRNMDIVHEGLMVQDISPYPSNADALIILLVRKHIQVK
jgi:hypothetical protein